MCGDRYVPDAEVSCQHMSLLHAGCSCVRLRAGRQQQVSSQYTSIVRSLVRCFGRASHGWLVRRAGAARAGRPTASNVAPPQLRSSPASPAMGRYKSLPCPDAARHERRCGFICIYTAISRLGTERDCIRRTHPPSTRRYACGCSFHSVQACQQPDYPIHSCCVTLIATHKPHTVTIHFSTEKHTLCLLPFHMHTCTRRTFHTESEVAHLEWTRLPLEANATRRCGSGHDVGVVDRWNAVG